MKRIILIDPSQCGKASLMQCMRGEAPHYRKTRVTIWPPATIDTLGEYFEDCCLYSTLLTSAYEADIIMLILNADASWPPLSLDFTGLMNRPVTGLATKAGLANPQRISLVGSWLAQAGAQKVFVTSVLGSTGVDEVFILLSTKEPSCLTK